MPSKTISDQYEAVTIATSRRPRRSPAGSSTLHGDNLMINPDMLDPNKMVNVPRSEIEEMKRSPGLDDAGGAARTRSHKDEVLDLMAYLLSRGDRQNPMFRQGAAPAGSVSSAR